MRVIGNLKYPKEIYRNISIRIVYKIRHITSRRWIKTRYTLRHFTGTTIKLRNELIRRTYDNKGKIVIGIEIYKIQALDEHTWQVLDNSAHIAAGIIYEHRQKNKWVW